MQSTLCSLFVVVTTELTRQNFRLLEQEVRVMVCVTKDLETARSFNVTLQTVEGTAFGEKKIQTSIFVISPHCLY